MAVFAGPKIIKDNLVMYMDKDNTVRSWKGKPTTNLLPASTQAHTGGMGSYWYGVISVNNTEKGFPSFKVTTVDDANNKQDGFITSSNGDLTDGTTYTWSADVWIPEGKSVMLRIRNITGGGYLSGSNVTVNGSSSWVRVSHTFTADTNTSGKIEGQSRDSTSDVYSFWVKNLQLEENDFATPFVAGTRSTTDAFIDPLNGIRFNSGNLDNYNSDGSFDFDGDSDFLYVNTASEVPVLYHKNFTLEAWVKRSETGRHDEILGDYQYGWLSFRINNSNKVTLSLIDYIEGAYQYPGITGTSTINAGEWYHVVVTWVYGSESRVYVNGRLDKVDSETYGSGVSGSGRGPRYIGRTTTGAPNAGNERYFKGDIGMVKVYEGKALTADEVVTNFEASRDRYGV